MEYNTTRNKLLIPEYGRNVQRMVEHALTIEDREKRNEMAKYIVRIMSNYNAGSGYGDYEQKVWDHLYIISDFKLDVDAPFPMPDKSKIAAKPKPVAYSDNNIRFRTYGRNMENIIKVAVGMEEGEEKDALVRLIAHNLKRAYLTWNRNSVDNEQIIDDLFRMSGGKLSVPSDFVFASTQEIIGKKKPRDAQKSYQSKNNNRNKQKNYRQSSRPSNTTNRRRTN